MNTETQLNITKARERWGQTAPEWVVALARACDLTSQSVAAKRLGVSNTMISNVLANCYTGKLTNIEQRVRGEYMNERVQCPVLGEITTRKCVDSQAWNRGFTPTNTTRLALRRECPACPNASGHDKEAA